MALNPLAYVPEGQVGTGIAYVHKLTDTTPFLEAQVAAQQNAIAQKKKDLAKISGELDLKAAKIKDPIHQQELAKIRQEIINEMSKLVVEGSDITDATTNAGKAFDAAKEYYKNKSETAVFVENEFDKFKDFERNAIPGTYNETITKGIFDEYDKNKDIASRWRLMGTVGDEYNTIKAFDQSKWIDDAVAKVALDREIAAASKDETEYANKFNGKLDEVKNQLLNDPLKYKAGEVQWKQLSSETDVDGSLKYPQLVTSPDGKKRYNTYAEYLNDQIESRKITRESTTEASKSQFNFYNTVKLPGQNEAGGGTVSTTNTGGKQSLVYLYNDPNNKTQTRTADGKIKLPAPSNNLKDLQGGVEDELGVFEIRGNDVFVDPVQYAKEYHYVGGKEYNVGQDPKYKSLDINLRKYNSSQTQNSAKLTTVFYDQGGNLWSQSNDGGFFLLAPRDNNSALYDEVSAELNAKAVLTTFFGITDANSKTKDEVFQLIKSNFSLQ